MALNSQIALQLAYSKNNILCGRMMALHLGLKGFQWTPSCLLRIKLSQGAASFSRVRQGKCRINLILNLTSKPASRVNKAQILFSKHLSSSGLTDEINSPFLTIEFCKIKSTTLKSNFKQLQSEGSCFIFIFLMAHILVETPLCCWDVFHGTTVSQCGDSCLSSSPLLCLLLLLLLLMRLEECSQNNA